MPGDEKLCFVIGPIGQEDSPERIKADWLLEEIVQPVVGVEPFNYEVRRADQFPQPGMITEQVINATLDAGLVIADLTGYNPNAFYELALRHMAGKPVIHMIHRGENIPFDIKDYRAVQYSVEHPKDIRAARALLEQQVRAVLDPSYRSSNPVTKARGQQNLEISADPKDKILADLVEEMGALRIQLTEIQARQLRDHHVRELGLFTEGVGRSGVVTSLFGESPGVAEQEKLYRQLVTTTAAKNLRRHTILTKGGDEEASEKPAPAAPTTSGAEE